ncbi:ABC transporter permease [Micromonospora echinofusca]|uniref:FtsX-like permease family protein n=1 Tax=Micromonospora echinofusca TaxID=47858 RepID=A0ABS3VIY5_MICEH|nr:FtsX-like permease family protein [Micromonospora echinofusca]MBO4204477.1 FtsX-like permease family protein [Micromonospora echinofusca]
MVRLTLRLLRADVLRLLLSSLATVLGVAFVAGTLMFTDGMKAGAYDRAGTFDRHTDVAVVADRASIPAGAVDRVRALPGVRAADGEFIGTGGLLGADGRPVLGYAVLVSIPTEPALRSYDLVAGRLPDRPGEVVLDERTVADEGFRLDTPVRVGGAGGPARPYTLVGTVDVAGTSRDVGGPYIGLVGPDALRAAGAQGYARILVAAAPGVPPAELVTRVGSAVTGAGASVQTRRQLLDAAVEDAVRDLEQFNLVLLIFAGVAAVVAGFVIANTFAIVLAQRTRRTALLRLVGATRGQLFRATVLEAAVVGTVAALAGVALGAGLASGLGAGAATLDLPFSGGIVLTAPTVLLCLLLGVTMTVGSALLPAWHGTRVAPVAALTDAAVQSTRRAGPLRLVAGALVLGTGVAALAVAGPAGHLLPVAAGGVLTFFGIVLFGPVLVPALVRVLGWPARRLPGATARLAVANAVRNPRRIAATATALVIGIGLVSAFVVGAHSTKDGIERSVDAEIGVDFLVTAVGADLPAGLVDELHARPELGVVHEWREVVRDGVRVRAAHPALVARAAPPVVAGDLGRFGPGTVLVHRELATARGWTVGATVTVAGTPLRIAAVVPGGDEGPAVGGAPVPSGHVVEVADADFTRLFPTERGQLAEVQQVDGISAPQAREVIESVVSRYPTANLMDQSAYKKMLTGTVDMLLAFVTALLGLAVVIALVGVANTLSLSVLERTRENAVLRAVGLTRGRLRAMLAVEAVLVAVVGAVLGIGLGTAVSASAMAVLNRIGGDFDVVLPWGQIGLILAVAALAALAASVLPARRAVRRPVVQALAGD